MTNPNAHNFRFNLTDSNRKVAKTAPRGAALRPGPIFRNAVQRRRLVTNQRSVGLRRCLRAFRTPLGAYRDTAAVGRKSNAVLIAPSLGGSFPQAAIPTSLVTRTPVSIATTRGRLAFLHELGFPRHRQRLRRSRPASQGVCGMVRTSGQGLMQERWPRWLHFLGLHHRL